MDGAVMALFRDRVDAGSRLAARLGHHADDPNALVLAIPRGAVVLGAEIARATGLPLDLVIVRKIGHPGNPEYAAGAVDPDGTVLENPASSVGEEYLRQEAERERFEIERRLAAYRGAAPALDVAGKTVILVDDGVATGLTALQAVRYLRRHGAAKIVLAVPVISEGAADLLSSELDELVALEIPTVFWAVGGFYVSFPQVSDAEVTRVLARLRSEE
jgi:predicted phosphoribosyltransferase